jgi:hypothetical protein
MGITSEANNGGGPGKTGAKGDQADSGPGLYDAVATSFIEGDRYGGR